MTEIEVRRLQRHTDYSYFLNVPKNLARLLDMHEGDLLRFGVNEKKQLIVEKATF